MVIINKMGSKRVIRGKSLEGTPFFISEDEQLGKGTYGEVYRCYNREQPSQQLVVKIISLLESDNQESIRTELEMIHELPHHENLVNCLKAHIASEKNLYVIMEYCNQGSLESYISKMTLMPEEQIWDILRQVCRGYQVLYDANLLHRDIKPENILIHNKVFKLADFGLSKKIKSHALSENLSYAGSPLYIAPEIIDRNEGSSKVDIFSLGSVLYELAYDGEPPFFKKDDRYGSPDEYYRARKNKKLAVPARNKKGERRSEELCHLISRMLEFNEADRISWEEVFEHPRININEIGPCPPQVLEHVISQEEHEL
jgi:serine/threonine protein kinase